MLELFVKQAQALGYQDLLAPPDANRWICVMPRILGSILYMSVPKFESKMCIRIEAAIINRHLQYIGIELHNGKKMLYFVYWEKDCY